MCCWDYFGYWSWSQESPIPILGKINQDSKLPSYFQDQILLPPIYTRGFQLGQWFQNFWFVAHCKIYKKFLAHLVYNIKNISIYFKLWVKISIQMGFFSFLKYTFIIFTSNLATSCGALFKNHCLRIPDLNISYIYHLFHMCYMSRVSYFLMWASW
jgi:hypothetical protein